MVMRCSTRSPPVSRRRVFAGGRLSMTVPVQVHPVRTR